MVSCTEEQIKGRFKGKTEINFVKRKTLYFCFSNEDYDRLELAGSYADFAGYNTIEMEAIPCEGQADCVTDEVALGAFLTKINVYSFEIAEEINFSPAVIESTGRPLEFALKRSDSLNLELGFAQEIT